MENFKFPIKSLCVWWVFLKLLRDTESAYPFILIELS